MSSDSVGSNPTRFIHEAIAQLVEAGLVSDLDYCYRLSIVTD
jgi:hypothetical protein